MAAWVVATCGCLIVIMGISTVNGWHAAQYGKPVLAGWGAVALGCGLGVEALPRLLGWSSRVGFLFATVGAGFVVVGAISQLLSRPAGKRRHHRGS